MKKEKILNLAGILLFYILIVMGVVLMNARFEQLNQNSSGVALVK